MDREETLAMIWRCAEGQRLKPGDETSWDGTNWFAAPWCGTSGSSWDLCPEMYLNSGQDAVIQRHVVFEIKVDTYPDTK